MSGEDKIIKLLTGILKIAESGQSDYCETDEACRIIGIKNYRYLAQLHKKDLLPRYDRADGFRYKKKDCHRIAAALDSKLIVLDPLSKKKDE